MTPGEVERSKLRQSPAPLHESVKAIGDAHEYRVNLQRPGSEPKPQNLTVPLEMGNVQAGKGRDQGLNTEQRGSERCGLEYPKLMGVE